LSGDSEEARQAKAELIANRIISTVKEDSIILMHDIYESTYDALVRVLAYLYSEGYEVVTVSELLGDKLKTGEKYYSGQ
jgi:peptidoglycan/xylan/chitin deacetylase (PgdA/CDA1 family)